MLKEKEKQLSYDEHMKCIESNGNHISKVPVKMVDVSMVKKARKNYAKVGQIPSKFHTFAMLVNDAPSYSQVEAKEFAETYCISSFGISVTAFAKLVVKQEIPNMSRVPEDLLLQVQNAVYSHIFYHRPEVAADMPKKVLENLMKKKDNFILQVYNSAYNRSKRKFGSDTWIGYKLLELFKEEDFSEEDIEHIQKDLVERLKYEGRGSHNRRPDMSVVPEFLITYDAQRQWMKNDGNALRHIPEKERNMELCKIAVNSCGDALRHVPEDLKKEFYIDAVKTGGLGSIPEEDRTDRLCTIAVEADPKEIKVVPEKRKTYAICLTAIDNNPELIEFVPEDNRDEEMIIRFLISIFKKNYSHDFVIRDFKNDDSKTLMQLAFDSVIDPEKFNYLSEQKEEKQKLINKVLEREPSCFRVFVKFQELDRWPELKGLLNLELCLTAFKGDENNISSIPDKFLVQVFKEHIEK